MRRQYGHSRPAGTPGHYPLLRLARQAPSHCNRTGPSASPLRLALFRHQSHARQLLRIDIQLSAQTFVYWRGGALVQYWRSFEDLERFARSKDDPHLAAWQRFNKSIGADGSVGAFHETYQIAAGGHEAIYANMPAFGLAAATQHVPITAGRHSARGRIGGADHPAAPPPATPELVAERTHAGANVAAEAAR